jgi:hypothetical protein
MHRRRMNALCAYEMSSLMWGANRKARTLETNLVKVCMRLIGLKSSGCSADSNLGRSVSSDPFNFVKGHASSKKGNEMPLLSLP